MKKSISIILALVLVLTITGTALAEEIVLPSGPGTSMVYGPLDAYAAPDAVAWGVGIDAVATWKHGSWPLITGSDAQWISSAYQTEASTTNSSWRKFETIMPLCKGAYDVSVSIQANADNAEEVWVNDTIFLGGDGEVQGDFVDNHEWATIQTYSTPNPLTVDEVKIDFIVRNYYQANGTPESNPTGLIYTITVNYSCPVEVDIDIKPGSYPSCFNNDGSGIIPVAINGSADFDVMTVDAGSVTLAGLTVAVKGKSDKLMAAYEDWNGDGYTDLMLKIVDVDDTFSQGSGTATVEGFLLDGTPFFGTGDICITQ